MMNLWRKERRKKRRKERPLEIIRPEWEIDLPGLKAVHLPTGLVMSFELIDAPAEPGGVYPGGGLDFLPASLEAEFERKKHWFDNLAKRRTRFIIPSHPRRPVGVCG